MNTDVGRKPDTRQEEDTIDLMELAGVLWQKAWAILLALVIGAGIAGFGTKMLITPQYQASAMIYIYSKTTSITSVADLQLSNQLAVDFQIVASTREVIESVISKLNLNMSYQGLLNTVTVTNPDGSHILKITVQNPNPVMAAEISNALADELRQRIADVMNTDMPSVVERAVVPTGPFNISVGKNAAMGGLAAAVLVAAVIVVLHLMDDTIKNEDDVRRYLGLNVLAAIPEEYTGKNSKGKRNPS